MNISTTSFSLSLTCALKVSQGLQDEQGRLLRESRLQGYNYLFDSHFDVSPLY